MDLRYLSTSSALVPISPQVTLYKGLSAISATLRNEKLLSAQSEYARGKEKANLSRYRKQLDKGNRPSMG
jgi:hypothetical protein